NLLTAQSPKPVPVKLMTKRATSYRLIVKTDSGLISVQRDDYKFNISVAKFWLILVAAICLRELILHGPRFDVAGLTLGAI
ncbi:MAG: hypothetical protein ACXW6J_08515, partial [Candidatus Binatia bacterium]